jgi:membrane peptidoglycan carboxypeptidase
VPLPSKWSVLTKANMAFGQGITVNAVQMCAAFAAAVNGGSLYRPHFMRSINNALGETIREHPQMETRRVIREETSRKLVEILREAVTRGTGKSAAIPGADVVGKTGTAQKADPNGGYSQDRYVASFIGALMGSKPRMVIFVMLDEPAGKIRTGGKAAAPVFRKIGEAVLASCGALPPAETEAAILAGKAAPKKPVLHGAPPKAVALRKGAKPGEWVVPDLKGLDMRQVIEICGQMKCDASFQGVGVAAEQDPKPGITLREGGRLTVSFESPAG